MEIERTEKPPQPAFQSSRRREELGGRAVAQHGAIDYGQLVALGLTRHEIRGMVCAGWLHAVHHGVFAVGRRSLPRKGRWMAAVLVCGPGALLSHRCAGALHGLLRTIPSVIDVTVPTRRGRGIEGVQTHLCRRLEAQDRDVVDGIPCTSVALTLLDIAAVTTRRQTERACDEAEVQRLFDLGAVREPSSPAASAP